MTNLNINCIVARCGAGKTQAVLKSLPKDTLVIFASKTIELSTQSFNDYVAMGNDAVRVDSESTNNVAKEVVRLFDTNFKGVMFITHAALQNIPNHILNKANVICDEIPQTLAKVISLSVLDKNASHIYSEWLETTNTVHEGYRIVRLKPEYLVEATSFVEAYNHKADTSISKNVVEVLEYLLANYAVMYTTTTNQVHGITHLFQAVHYMPLDTTVKNSKMFTVMAANLKDSLFGFVATNILGMTINEVSAGLEQKHKQKVKIIPFLKSGSWSSSLKKQVAQEAIEGLHSTYTVAQEIQFFASQQLSQDFLLFKNEADDVCVNQTRATVLSTQVHGINAYRYLSQAAFVGSLRPTPYETKLLNVFATDANLNSSELVQAVVTERCYEAAYQCVARTGIRNAYDANDTNEYIFVVPDMGYAHYIASWFENGCVDIDTTNSFELRTNRPTSYSPNQAKIDARLQVAISVLTDKKNKIAKMPEILLSHGIHRNTFAAYKKEFEVELRALGLIK